MRLENRFGFGPTFRVAHEWPADTAAVGDPHGSPPASATHREIVSASDAIESFLIMRENRRLAKVLIVERLQQGAEAPSMGQAVREVADGDPTLRSIQEMHLRDRMERALEATDQLHERLVWFWSNHLAVSRGAGGPLRVLAGPFELEAIRPHVAGRFENMLLAAVRHSAMLRYLDGRGSVGPNSTIGRRDERGLNENLAREILELHTLGVDGGYDQADVEALAMILSGWRCRGIASNEPGAFVFSQSWHEPGAKTLLGKTYAVDGFKQGVAALRDLARHPSTAGHLSRKLARHFIADEPPERLVRDLTTLFVETDGDLAAVTQMLVQSPEGRAAPPAKLRLPQEFLVAMLRAANVQLEPRLLDRMCRIMGQPVWEPPGPDGFPDTVPHWLSPEGMKRRLDVAMAVAERVDPALEPMNVLEVTVGDIAGDETRLAVSRAESRQQAFTLLFMSPEFQWR